MVSNMESRNHHIGQNCMKYDMEIKNPHLFFLMKDYVNQLGSGLT